MKTKEKITVGETLEWLGKLEKLSTKPAKILHIRNLLIRELSLQKQEIVEEIDKILRNIKRFDDKEKGTDYFAGWDSAIDTMSMDLEEFKQTLTK